MKRKNTAAAALIISTALLLISSFSVLFFYPEKDMTALSVFSENDSQYGTVNIKTADAETLEPVAGAVIYIPEENASYITKSDGTAKSISLKIDTHDTVGRITTSLGTADILIYADEYPPHAYLDIWLDNTRERTMTLLMHHTEGYYAEREAPPSEWITGILEEYRQQ